MKIAYNAGHILATPGKRIPAELDPAQTREWTINDRVARAFAREMERYRNVELRRLDDPEGLKPLDIDARVAQANLWPADFYLSIHHNAAGRIFDGGGVEVYLDAPGGPSEQYARAIYEAVVGATGLRGDRVDPIRTGDEAPLYETRATDMPAVLVEYGFMDSRTDAPVILTEEFSVKAGRATAQAIARIAGLEREEESAMFTDVDPNAWYAEAVEQAAKLGLMQGGGDGTFRPNDAVTRAELAAVITRLVEKME